MSKKKIIEIYIKAQTFDLSAMKTQSQIFKKGLILSHNEQYNEILY